MVLAEWGDPVATWTDNGQTWGGEVLLAHRQELRMFDATGRTYLRSLAASDVEWSVGLHGRGYLSARVDVTGWTSGELAQIEDPAGVVIKVRIALDTSVLADDTDDVAAFAVRTCDGMLWEGAGRRTWQISGAPTTTRAWLADAILYPESNTLVRSSGDERCFGPQSLDYDVSSWAYATEQARTALPDGWPDWLSGAKWIDAAAEVGERKQFARDVEIPVDAKRVTVLVSSDEPCTVYFGAEQILATDDDDDGWSRYHKWTATPTGRYRSWNETTQKVRLLIESRTVDSPAGSGGLPGDYVLCGAWATMPDGSREVLRVTDGVWRARVGDEVPAFWWTAPLPGMTPGQIMSRLITEAVARGVTSWEDAVNAATWSASLDSYGYAWPSMSAAEMVVPIGVDYAHVADLLADVGINFEIRPNGDPWLSALDYYQNPLEAPPSVADYDAAVGMNAAVSYDAQDFLDDPIRVWPILTPGVNVAGVWRRQTSPEASTVAAWTEAGWVVVDQSPFSDVGRRERRLDLGGTLTVDRGAAVAMQALRNELSGGSEWTVVWYATEAAKPLVDVLVGYEVKVAMGGVEHVRKVTMIGASAPHTEAIIRWEVTTDNIAVPPVQRDSRYGGHIPGSMRRARVAPTPRRAVWRAQPPAL